MIFVDFADIFRLLVIIVTLFAVAYFDKIVIMARISHMKQCIVCQQAIIKESGISLYRESDLTKSSVYCHYACLDLASGFTIGLHNVIKQSTISEWLIFWQGSCLGVKGFSNALAVLKEYRNGLQLSSPS